MFFCRQKIISNGCPKKYSTQCFIPVLHYINGRLLKLSRVLKSTEILCKTEILLKYLNIIDDVFLLDIFRFFFSTDVEKNISQLIHWRTYALGIFVFFCTDWEILNNYFRKDSHFLDYTTILAKTCHFTSEQVSIFCSWNYGKEKAFSKAVFLHEIFSKTLAAIFRCSV